MLTPTGVTQEQYLAALKAANPVTHVRFTFPIQNVVLTDQDITVDGGVQYETMLNPDTDLTFGRAICSNLQVQLVNSDKVTNILWSEEFTFEMGVEISGTTYWVTLGYFKGTRPEKLIDVDVVDFSATDRMSMFDILADDWLKSLTYPMTVTQMFQSLCTYVGVPYETGDELSNIASRNYSKAPFDATGFTCRDILGWIAEACGTYAKIANNGKCKLVWYHDHQADYTVTESDRYALNVSEVAWITDSTEKKTWEDLESYTWEELEAYLWREIEGERCPFEIKAVKVTMTEDDVGVIVPSNYTDRYNIYQIIDNPYLSTENDTEVGNYITPILTRLTAFGKYIPMTVDCIGNWLIEPGDEITVIIGSNNHAKMPIFCRTLTWNGSCNDIYETTGNLEREPLSMMNREKFKSGGKIHEVRRTIDDMYERIQNQFGDYSTTQQTATMIGLYVASKADIIYSDTAPTWLNRPAEPYSLRTYAVGEYCLHTANGVTKSYRCTTAITTAHAWDASEWTEDVLPVAVGTIWVDTSPYLQTEADEYDPAETYNSGDQSEHDGSVYTCNTDNTTGTWDSTKWDLYESPVPKNEWKKYNGSSWDSVSENNTYERKSGIEITDNGVSIFGNKYVRISASENGSYWSYSKNGLTFYNNGNNSFRFGATTNLNISSFAGFYDYMEDLSGNRYNKNSAMLHASHYGSVLNMRYLFWAVDNVDSDYRGVLRANATGCYLGSSGVPWGGAYINKLFGYLEYESDVLRRYETHIVPRFGSSTSFRFRDIYYHSGAQAGNTVISIAAENATAFYIYGATVTSSSRKLKENIKPVQNVGELIDSLKPVTFSYKKDTEKKQQFGLIFEDAIQILPEICTVESDDPGECGIDYSKLTPILLKEIQDLRKRVKELEKEE